MRGAGKNEGVRGPEGGMRYTYIHKYTHGVFSFALVSPYLVVHVWYLHHIVLQSCNI
jgi:hypothetical protein